MSEALSETQLRKKNVSLSLANDVKEIYTEYFIFYAPPTQYTIINFYINNIPLIENFISNFLIKTTKLIERADQERIVTAWRIPEINVEVPNWNEISTNEPPLILSNRQKQVMHHMIQGKTARESAHILGLSTRTIEYYIDNIKTKLNCSKKSELIVRILQEDLL